MDARAQPRNLYVLTEQGSYKRIIGEGTQPAYQWIMGPMAALVPGTCDGVEIIAAGARGPDPSEGLEGRSDVLLILETVPGNPQATGQLVVDPSAPSGLYMAVDGPGVLRSDDMGSTWALLGSGLEAREIRALVFHSPSQTFYAGTELGVYVLRTP